MTVAYRDESTLRLSMRGEPWRLSYSAFFLPAFCSVYSIHLRADLSKGQGSFFI